MNVPEVMRLKQIVKMFEKFFGSPNGTKFNNPTQRVGSILPKLKSPEKAKHLILPFQSFSNCF
jgi:hypothetical protein